MSAPEPIPEFPFHHGRLALSFAGTVGDRGSLQTERLATPRAFAAWLCAAALTSHVLPVTPRAHARAIEVREAIARIAAALVAGKKPLRADIALINAVAQKHAPRTTLDPRTLRIVESVRDPVTAALANIARDAIELFGSPEERTRLRTCGMASCGSVFLTPAGRRERRWCSMARCGNRAKASTHRKKMPGPAA
jgi:predicted RNA-binding Zn ribbon-like protein